MVLVPSTHAYARDVREVNLGAGERQVDDVEVGAKTAVHDALGRNTRRAPGPRRSLSLNRIIPVADELGSRTEFPQPGEQVLHLGGLSLRLECVGHPPRELHVRRLNLDKVLRHRLPRRGVIEPRVGLLHLERRRAHGPPNRRTCLVPKQCTG